MKRVLIVEDEKDISEIIKELLESQGFNVDVCSDGLSGYTKYNQESQNYDLIITDIMMDIMNGDEMIHLLHKCNCKSKIIVITAIGTDIDKDIIKNSKIDSFLEKPFSISELNSKINSLL